MEIVVDRRYRKEDYTISRMFINGQFFCNTLEPPVRDLNDNGIFDCGETKIEGKSAIPFGRYKITLDVKSPKYSDFTKYPWAQLYDGYLPRLIDVPHFEGVLIHVGNTVKDTAGCLLCGKNTVKGKVTSSTLTFCSLMNEYLLPAKQRGEEIYITIE